MPSLETNSVRFFRSSNFSMPAGMREQHLRILLEDRRDRDGRDVLRDRVERLQRVGAHEEVELAGGQQNAVVHLRPARHDGDVEAVFLVGAVGDRLIEAAVLGLAPPNWCRSATLSSGCACGGRQASPTAAATCARAWLA